MPERKEFSTLAENVSFKTPASGNVSGKNSAAYALLTCRLRAAYAPKSLPLTLSRQEAQEALFLRPHDLEIVLPILAKKVILERYY